MLRSPTHRRPLEAAPAGSSLLELLLAALLFLVAVLALAPLFVRAAADVRAGAERSEASALAALLIEGGAAPGLWFYARDERRWARSPPAPPDLAVWVASAAVREYPLAALDDGRIEPAEALGDAATGSTEETRVVLRGTEVRVSRAVGGRAVAVVHAFDWTTR